VLAFANVLVPLSRDGVRANAIHGGSRSPLL